jgi:4-hydroxy-2,2'-bipyrrole-5-carbaldehyde O-methyltransferase
MTTSFAANFRSLLRVLRAPHLRAQFGVMQDLRAFSRVDFLCAAFESGLLRALRRPASRERLVRELGVKRPELLEPLLDLGVALGELSERGEVYRLKGSRARALASESGDPLAAVVQEYVTYHGSVYKHLAARMSGAPLGDYLRGTGNLIARSSRVLEPFMEGFVQGLVRGKGRLKILEVGCGSGIYLRYAAQANRQVSGVGIDMQPEVAEMAVDNLAKWGVGGRFKVLTADIRNPSLDLDGPFDLITLYNNIYYFAPEERPALFRSLRSRLAPTGALAITSPIQGSRSVTTADFDLILRSTIGCFALPEMDELTRQLREGGFEQVQWEKLFPTEPYYGVVAT